MNTYRITVSSFLVAAMSVYACLLFSDPSVLAQQAVAVNKSQSAAGLRQEEEQPGAPTKKSVKIDKRPLVELLRRVFDSQQRGDVDLDSAFEIIIEGNFDSDGLIQNVEITQNSGDPALKQLAAEFVAAFNDSRALAFIEGAKHLRLAIASSETGIAANAAYETESSQEARNKAQGYKTLLFMGAIVKKGRDEELIFKNLTVSSRDREVIANFSMPRETFCALLSKYLSSH